MNLSFYGAAETVTGSCFLLEAAGEKILIDCGMFQGGNDLWGMNREPFQFNPAELKHMILTHAISTTADVYRNSLKTDTRERYTRTSATRDLCEIMLEDSAHISEMEAEYDTRKNKRKGMPPAQPLYTVEEAAEAMKYFSPVEVETVVKISDKVSFKLYDAGHMLGSSFVEIYVNENEKQEKIVFSGDLGNVAVPLLKDPHPLADADYGVMESTYGGRNHTPIAGNENELLNVITSTLDKGGTLVIPSFAVGRTQEVLYEINKYKEKKMLGAYQDVKVIVDSPMAIKTTEVFKKYYHDFDKETQQLIQSGDDPLVFDNLVYSMTTEESKAINFDDSPKIIISASGMCDAGRIRHHIKHNIFKENSTLLLVGYQAEGSLGRILLEGAKDIKLFGERIAVKARVMDLDYFSGHADHDHLIAWINNMQTKPKRMFLVHGERSALEAVSEGLSGIGVTSEIAKYFSTVNIETGDIVAQGEGVNFVQAHEKVSAKLPGPEYDLTALAETILAKLKDKETMKKVVQIDKIKLFLECIDDILSSE